ncbi:hypothetical protein FKW77_004573 [Venturia effusa]|uniref:Uncharacterized protein n=1 Tax=Venturia effusa TaxID=50376 RepID=A0A517LMQ2_9PEZI|nr:hypothetical protein FKW77_004573 [Venturia effusa]
MALQRATEIFDDDPHYHLDTRHIFTSKVLRDKRRLEALTATNAIAEKIKTVCFVDIPHPATTTVPIFFHALSLFVNMRTLRIDGQSELLLDDLQGLDGLPHFHDIAQHLHARNLSKLVICRASVPTADLVTLIGHHIVSLNSLVLLRIRLDDGASWPTILRTASDLPKSASIHIAAPSINSPQESVGFEIPGNDPDIEAVHVVDRQGTFTSSDYICQNYYFSYYSKPNQLHRALACLVRNYKVAVDLVDGLNFTSIGLPGGAGNQGKDASFPSVMESALGLEQTSQTQHRQAVADEFQLHQKALHQFTMNPAWFINPQILSSMKAKLGELNESFEELVWLSRREIVKAEIYAYLPQLDLFADDHALGLKPSQIVGRVWKEAEGEGGDEDME